ncbi:D-alanyl-D-alanine carboxypeptidase family protein [Bhargavaea cecembensis]|uniref:D-alanyl-D-alanine carboxypeptidase family protein n=1 Tax=Bhargavaea cecembensis TaxID=394098 RepID=UPI00059031DC|nr:serine hydrolase [Bhargavaea cecembensis]
MKRFLLFCIVAGAVLVVLYKPGIVRLGGGPDDDSYTSKYIYVADRESGEAVFQKRADEKAYPASLTKIMTTIVALERIGDLSEKAPVDLDTYRKMVAANASMAGFYGREPVTFRDLLYGTVLNSGGEAANSLAVNTAGSIGEFVRLMNEKAAELGMDGTHFTNPEGLHDPDQYTTAADMAKLLDYALGDGNFRTILTKESFQTTPTPDHPGGILLRSTVLSRLQNVQQDGFRILGGKSGTTYEAGECWATLAEKNGKEYIAVVMGAPLQDIHHPDGAQIADSLRLYGNIR